MPNALRIAARLLTGSTYIKLGYDAARTPGGRVDLATPMLAKVRKVVPVPVSDEQVVRANAGAQVVGGAMLAAGVLPRTAALTVMGSLVPTTLAGHAFWTIDDPAQRKQQQVQFHKNMALLGGLAFAVLDRGKRG
ncbi:MAG: DoxX family membrane protein [Actinomycetia bacterium]|nr:DoxX family membrane protein [Actinomycetes bacterium]